LKKLNNFLIKSLLTVHSIRILYLMVQQVLLNHCRKKCSKINHFFSFSSFSGDKCRYFNNNSLLDKKKANLDYKCVSTIFKDLLLFCNEKKFVLRYFRTIKPHSSLSIHYHEIEKVVTPIR